MAIYYIDAENGDNRNSGLHEDCPLFSDSELNLKPGDTVLFKRGTIIRGGVHNVSGAEGKPIKYAAYGVGKAPIFCGSVDLKNPDLWFEEKKNIWICMPPVNDELANIVFNKGESCGTLRWTKKELTTQGDFFDECFGFKIKKKKIPDKHKIYLYSEKNPALFYTSVEGAFYGESIMMNNGNDMIIENLKFINAGVHAIAGARDSKNLLIRNCVFEYIGGGVWDYEQKIRYGNAVEFWNVAENIEVYNCIFNDIYDSAVTHQGAEECEPCINVNFHHNVFIKCGMAAYEQRDRLPLRASFYDNICVDAGEGFSKNGEVMPRFSEIWPQPMGHHIFLWRIEKPTDSGSLSIKNNIFYNAPYGAAIYSIIAEAAEDQTKLAGNTYYTENHELMCRWHGEDYRTFEECSYIDKLGKCEKVDIQAVVKARIDKILSNQNSGGEYNEKNNSNGIVSGNDLDDGGRFKRLPKTKCKGRNVKVGTIGG